MGMSAKDALSVGGSSVWSQRLPHMCCIEGEALGIRQTELQIIFCDSLAVELRSSETEGYKAEVVMGIWYWKGERGGLGVQDHPQLLSLFRAIPRHMKPCLKSLKHGDWRDGSMIKSARSSRGPEFCSQNPRQAAHNSCHSSSTRSDTFRLLWALADVHTDTSTYM